ncbi:hypothetical protein [Streptomyces sp. NPDC002564]|uniref:hypothetical protein n=1 Tax=Streptomyces sp. NPDC002564 TaxID=3364649 RepID=UPI0036CCC901
MKIRAAVSISILVATATSCSTQSQTAHEEIGSCKEGRFSWQVNTRWRLTVLDDLENLGPGKRHTFHPLTYRPRVSKVTGSTAHLSKSDISHSLLKKVQAGNSSVNHLIDAGTSTASEARSLAIEPGNKMQAVYYRGILSVDAKYAFRCLSNPEKDTNGQVFTWDRDSPTTGLVNCLARPEDNSRSPLAKSAIRQRCPTGSPATAQASPRK